MAASLRLGHYIDRRTENNFLLLRFIAASLVIYSHCWPLLNGSYLIPYREMFADIFHERLTGGALAVDAFFVISGLLVTQSFARRGSLVIYIKARLLRILPALYVVVLFCALVVGPWMTTLPLGEYFGDAAVPGYCFYNMLLVEPAFDLPGVFTDLPHTRVNGSLWTLPAEARMYVWVAILGVLGVWRKRWLANLALILLVTWGRALPDWLPMINDNPEYPRLGMMFLVGAAFYINRHILPLDGRVAAGLALLALFTRDHDRFLIFYGAALCYGTMWLAYVPNFHWYNRFGDYSYGIYLYAFPVQQVLVSFLPGMSLAEFFLYAWSITLVPAVLSWHLIEKPALALKKVKLRGLFWPSGQASDRPTGA